MQQQVADTKNHNCGIFWRSNVQEQPNSNFDQVQNLLSYNSFEEMFLFEVGGLCRENNRWRLKIVVNEWTDVNLDILNTENVQ